MLQQKKGAACVFFVKSKRHAISLFSLLPLLSPVSLLSLLYLLVRNKPSLLSKKGLTLFMKKRVQGSFEEDKRPECEQIHRK